MKIQFCSDLHLEFKENLSFLNQHPVEPVGDVLLLAGDIVPFIEMNKYNDFFNYVSDHFKTTYWIPGNHEYYYSDISKKCGKFKEKIRSNVFLLNNKSVQIENIRFVFSTLWSKISPSSQWAVATRMSDFKVIKHNGLGFTPDHFNQLHEDSIIFIKEELQKHDLKNTVVITHHIPTFQHYPAKYKGDALNEAFAVELFDFIETNGPGYWIYGHHHYNAPDFKIGKTSLLTNQLGYVKYNENKLFNRAKIIEIGK